MQDIGNQPAVTWQANYRGISKPFILNPKCLCCVCTCEKKEDGITVPQSNEELN